MAGLYIHIPYCSAKCYYCDFYSGSGMGRQREYIDALVREFELRKDEFSEDFTTIYIGGGTPSSLPFDLFEELLQHIEGFVDRTLIKEFTVEVNPEDVSHELLEMMLRHGVNRVSMGIQSLIDDELLAVGRRHTAVRAIEAAKMIAECFTEYSFDLIFGLPGQTLDSLQYSIDGLLALHPPHMSLYLLSYEPGTRLYARLIAGKMEETDEQIVQNMYSYITKRMKQAGYEHYEISNYSKPGHESQHNTSYWFSVPYLGLGASAHSFDGTNRRYNPSDIKSYLSSLSVGNAAFIEDNESDDNRLNDIIITRLRTGRGLSPRDMSDTDYRCLLPVVNRLLATGQLERVGWGVRIPEDMWLVSDNILRELIV